MATLLSTLLSSSGALRAYDRVLEVTQNNVANASTPGYAKQVQSLYAMPFDADRGLTGGVHEAEIRSARDEYAEQAVRRQESALGDSDQKVDSLTALQSFFDVSGTTGIPDALNNLFQAFSSWGMSPNSAVAQQAVLDGAADVARSFQQTASGLDSLARDTEQQIHDAVDHINSLAQELVGYNEEIRRGNAHDAGLDARVHTALEELSQIAGLTTLRQSDGTLTVLLGGVTPLVAGDQQYELTYDLYQPSSPPPTYPDGPPAARVTAADGSDITAQVTTGQLGALLDFRNRVLAGFIGSADQPGELNRMAKSLADRINTVLAAGNVSDGPPPVPGAALFSYDGGNDTNIAQSLSVTAATPDGLGAIDPGPPYVANGIPVKLSALATPQDEADKIDGFSYNEFYGVLAASVGRQLSDAQNTQEVQQSLAAQAKSLRQQTSGVSLDEEAAIMLQFQRGYQANAELIKVLDELTQDTIDIMN
jgi:flagellar hook-associated protein 1 FlgK